MAIIAATSRENDNDNDNDENYIKSYEWFYVYERDVNVAAWFVNILDMTPYMAYTFH